MSALPYPPFVSAANQSLTVGGTAFAFREVGDKTAAPLILLNHWGAALDDFDPRIVDGLAQTRRVIALDYRGVGGSGGSAPLTVAHMAEDVTDLIGALGFASVDLLGFSLGGFVAQQIALQAPELVRHLILTGTGPAGGVGIDRVGAVSWPLMLKAVLTLRDPRSRLFFTCTPDGRRAASAFLQRLKERRDNRDNRVTPRALLRQLQAIRAWGRQAPQDLGQLHMPTLVVNGDNDLMVPSVNSIDLANRIPHAQMILYEDAGHGAIFQNYADFVSKALTFLDTRC